MRKAIYKSTRSRKQSPRDEALIKRADEVYSKIKDPHHSFTETELNAMLADYVTLTKEINEVNDVIQKRVRRLLETSSKYKSSIGKLKKAIDASMRELHLTTKELDNVVASIPEGHVSPTPKYKQVVTEILEEVNDTLRKKILKLIEESKGIIRGMVQISVTLDDKDSKSKALSAGVVGDITNAIKHLGSKFWDRAVEYYNQWVGNDLDKSIDELAMLTDKLKKVVSA